MKYIKNIAKMSDKQVEQVEVQKKPRYVEHIHFDSKWANKRGKILFDASRVVRFLLMGQ